MAASLLQGPYDHLLFHVVEIAERHGAAAAPSGHVLAARDFAAEFGSNFNTRDLPLSCSNGQLCNQVPQFANITRPRMTL